MHSFHSESMLWNSKSFNIGREKHRRYVLQNTSHLTDFDVKLTNYSGNIPAIHTQNSIQKTQGNVPGIGAIQRHSNDSENVDISEEIQVVQVGVKEKAEPSKRLCQNEEGITYKDIRLASVEYSLSVPKSLRLVSEANIPNYNSLDGNSNFEENVVAKDPSKYHGQIYTNFKENDSCKDMSEYNDQMQMCSEESVSNRSDWHGQFCSEERIPSKILSASNDQIHICSEQWLSLTSSMENVLSKDPTERSEKYLVFSEGAHASVGCKRMVSKVGLKRSWVRRFVSFLRRLFSCGRGK